MLTDGTIHECGTGAGCFVRVRATDGQQLGLPIAFGEPSAPTITVTPDERLDREGQVVTVRGRGFTANRRTSSTSAVPGAAASSARARYLHGRPGRLRAGREADIRLHPGVRDPGCYLRVYEVDPFSTPVTAAITFADE